MAGEPTHAGDFSLFPRTHCCEAAMAASASAPATAASALTAMTSTLHTILLWVAKKSALGLHLN